MVLQGLGLFYCNIFCSSLSISCNSSGILYCEKSVYRLYNFDIEFFNIFFNGFSFWKASLLKKQPSLWMLPKTDEYLLLVSNS